MAWRDLLQSIAGAHGGRQLVLLGDYLDRFRIDSAASRPVVPLAADYSELSPPPPPRAVPLLRMTYRERAEDRARIIPLVSARMRDIGTLEYLSLAPSQRLVWSVLTYDAAVRAGGHRQYFRVYGLARAGEALEALAELKLQPQCGVLAEAMRRDLAYLDDYATTMAASAVAERLGHAPDYADLDAACRHLTAEVRGRLDDYLWTHLTDFVELEAAEQGDEADEP